MEKVPALNSSKLKVECIELFNLYSEKKMSYKTIGDMYGVDASTVMRKIKKCDIPPRSPYETLRLEIDDPLIAKLYLEEGKSCNEIALIVNVSRTTISNRLKEMNVELKAQREFVSGDKSNFWNGGISDENVIIRSSADYRKWREGVFKRDGYTCQCCLDDTGGNLHAHHIENFSSVMDKRFDINNGITLCNDCHSPSEIGSFHHTYGTRDNNAIELIEYIKIRRRELGINVFEIPGILKANYSN